MTLDWSGKSVKGHFFCPPVGGFFVAAGSAEGRKMSGPNRPPNSTIITDRPLACQGVFGIMP